MTNLNKKWRIELEITPDGVTANGANLGIRTMYRKDLRGYSGKNTIGTVYYRRALVRKDLFQAYGIKLPRGADIGYKWTVVVKSALFGTAPSWGTDSEEISEFGQYGATHHFILLDDTPGTTFGEIPVTPENAV